MRNSLRPAPLSVPLASRSTFPMRAPSQQRIADLERQRRRDLLIPANISMIVLTMTGYLPALRPDIVPPLLVGLTVELALFGLSLWLARSGYISASSWSYIISLVLFYGVALFITPGGAGGEIAASHFTAGNLYYTLASVLPVIASTLLLDFPLYYLIVGVVFLMNMVAIWFLPHDATFAEFTSHLGGPLFLAASMTAGQVVLIVFGVAAANSIRRALATASRVADLAEINRLMSERQRRLEADIRTLQETHAQIANGARTQIMLSSSSELYPVAVSLNLLEDRFSRVSRAAQDLQEMERGLATVSQYVTRLTEGDLSHRPDPTGTPVDGLLATLIQFQGRIVVWVRDVRSFIRSQQHPSATNPALDRGATILQALERIRLPENT